MFYLEKVHDVAFLRMVDRDLRAGWDRATSWAPTGTEDSIVGCTDTQGF